MKLAPLAVITMMVSGGLYAQDIVQEGTIPYHIKTQAAQKGLHATAQKASTNIRLMKIRLSEKAQKQLPKRVQMAKLKPLMAASAGLPKRVQLGMNKVPVLNQGAHGSCVTFATTAAIDAAMGKGDYVSQLCNLQLGSYLETNGYNMSGWNGSWGSLVLEQMNAFGIVSKDHQVSEGCGGLTEYPLYDENTPESSMSLETFHAMSESLNDNGITWSPILHTVDAFSERLDTNNTLISVKKALSQGDRVTFGVLLLDFDLGTAGAVGSHNAKFDSWVLTPEIARDTVLHPDFGGHEMLITGYDDDAVAIDDQGREHRGLLTLRNSWGPDLADKGDFYMSYDFFKLLVIEAHRVRSMYSMDDTE